ITVKRGLNYKADCRAICEFFNVENIKDVPVKFKTSQELDVKGYEWYRKSDPKVYERISQYVTVTPKKVAVTLVVK
ncbi:hypothetical protein LCGC14_3076070, partial [marine sediment metagenome]